MKQEEAKGILKWHGFEVDEMDLIWYKSDRVGDLAGALVTLADYIPSMIDADYKSVNKTIININGSYIVPRIEDQINRLYDTQNRWEEHLRESRLNRVKQYFKEQELKRLRRNELISSIERGEHLSREELRELSAMGYAI